MGLLQAALNMREFRRELDQVVSSQERFVEQARELDRINARSVSEGRSAADAVSAATALALQNQRGGAQPFAGPGGKEAFQPLSEALERVLLPGFSGLEALPERVADAIKGLGGTQGAGRGGSERSGGFQNLGGGGTNASIGGRITEGRLRGSTEPERDPFDQQTRPFLGGGGGVASRPLQDRITQGDQGIIDEIRGLRADSNRRGIGSSSTRSSR